LKNRFKEFIFNGCTRPQILMRASELSYSKSLRPPKTLGDE
jgi:hypothetical protein